MVVRSRLGPTRSSRRGMRGRAIEEATLRGRGGEDCSSGSRRSVRSGRRGLAVEVAAFGAIPSRGDVVAGREETKWS